MVNKSGNVLFVVHDNHTTWNHIPLGPAYLASVLRNQGHNVDFFCQDVTHASNGELAKHLKENKYDMIGLGFIAAKYSTIVRDVAKTIQDNKGDAKFVLGGHCPTAVPEYTLKDTKADAVLLGEAEKIVTPVLESIIQTHSIPDIPGIVTNKNGKITNNGRIKPIKNLDSIPFPAWDLLPIDEYADNFRFIGADEDDRTLSLITTRGCIGNCSFCYRMEKGIRGRSIENIVDEMEILQDRFNISYFMFQDEMFLPNRGRVKEFSESINKRLKKPHKYICIARAELAQDPNTLEMLKDSGCCFVNLGIESLDQEVLDTLGKRVTVEQNLIATENVIASGIAPGLNVIWGLPRDTEESLQKIVDYLIKYDPCSQLRTIRPPIPYPGAPLYYQSVASGDLSGPGDFFDKFTNTQRFVVNFTGIPEREAYDMMLAANKTLVHNFYKKKVKAGEKTRKQAEDEAFKIISGLKSIYNGNTELDEQNFLRSYGKND